MSGRTYQTVNRDTVMAKEQRGTDIYKSHSAFIVTAAACALCLLLVACGSSTQSQWQEQYDLGEQYLLEGDYEQAIVAFTAAIEIDPNAVDAYLGRAEAYLEGDAASASEESLQLALSDYSAALELDDTLTDAYVHRGDAYVAAGADDDLSAALQDYTSALSLDNTRTDVYIRRGDVYYSFGTENDLIAAAADYASAMALDETISEAYLGAAGVDLLLYNYESALDVLGDGASHAEDTGEIEEQLAYVERIVSAEEEWKADLIDTFAELEEDPFSIGMEDRFGDDLREFLSGLEDPVRWEGEDEQWMLLYPSGYVYYGEMEDGLRGGQGIWLRFLAQADESGGAEDAAAAGDEEESDEVQEQRESEEILALFYIGDWADDYPNGQGQYYRLFRGGGVDTDCWMIVCEMEFTDGKADGAGILRYVSDLSSEEPYSEECEIEAADGMLTLLYEDDGQTWTALMDTVRFNASRIFIPGAVNENESSTAYKEELAFDSDMEYIVMQDRWTNISDDAEDYWLFLNYRKYVWTELNGGEQSLQLEILGADEDETYTWTLCKASTMGKGYGTPMAEVLDYTDYDVSLSEDGLLTFRTDLKSDYSDCGYGVYVEVTDSKGRYGICEVYVATAGAMTTSFLGETIMMAETEGIEETDRQLLAFTSSGSNAEIVSLLYGMTHSLYISNGRYVGGGVYYSGDMVVPEIITFDGTDYDVTAINYSAFQSATELTSVYIPSSVREIEDISTYNNPFEGCDSLREIMVADGNTAYKSVDGVLYSANGSTLYSYPCAAEATSYTIPSGTTAIGDTAFYHCWNLEEIRMETNGSTYFAEDGILYIKYGYGYKILAYPLGNDRTELVLPEYATNVYGEALAGSALKVIDASAGTKDMDLSITSNSTRTSYLYLDKVIGGPEMTELEIGLTSTEDLSWLLDMPNLERLVIYLTEYGDIDTDSLSQMSSLTYLGIVIDDPNENDDSVIEEALNELYEALPDCAIISR